MTGPEGKGKEASQAINYTETKPQSAPVLLQVGRGGHGIYKVCVFFIGMRGRSTLSLQIIGFCVVALEHMCQSLWGKKGAGG